MGLAQIEEECRQRHRDAYRGHANGLPGGGRYQWRREGEYHMWNPDTIAKLQYAAQSNQYSSYREFAEFADGLNQRLCTIRGLLEFKTLDEPIDLDEVEPASEIVKRFATGAVSLGSISREAHETMAIAMNRIGARSNTGEGGEDFHRYTPDANGDSPQQHNETGRVRQVRRDDKLPEQRHRPADQDGAGIQARRGRATSRPQSGRVHRLGAQLNAGRRADFAAAAPRHLLDRGPGPANLRP